MTVEQTHCHVMDHIGRTLPGPARTAGRGGSAYRWRRRSIRRYSRSPRPSLSGARRRPNRPRPRLTAVTISLVCKSRCRLSKPTLSFQGAALRLIFVARCCWSCWFFCKPVFNRKYITLQSPTHGKMSQ